MIPHPQIQPSLGHMVLYYIFIEKILHISGPAQFKLTLFNGQQYLKIKGVYPKSFHKEKKKIFFLFKKYI